MSDYHLPMRLMIILLLSGSLSCTANQPKTLNALEVPRYSHGIASHRLYSRTDSVSFMMATTKYPAKNGYHKVPVGEYLLAGVMDAFRGVSASKIRLSEFSSWCIQSEWFWPRALCKTSFTVSYELDGKRRTIHNTLERDIGHVLVKDDNLLFGMLMHVEYNDLAIRNQVKLAIDDVLEYVATQIPK